MLTQFLQVLLANWLAIFVVILLLALWKWQKEEVLSVIRWSANILTEPDGNGGKASVSRVIGLYVAWNIIQQSWTLPRPIDGILWDLFMITLGYSFLSKVLNSMSPAILDFAKGYRDKMAARVPRE
jgi:hypothetical protein